MHVYYQACIGSGSCSLFSHRVTYLLHDGGSHGMNLAMAAVMHSKTSSAASPIHNSNFSSASSPSNHTAHWLPSPPVTVLLAWQVRDKASPLARDAAVEFLRTHQCRYLQKQSMAAKRLFPCPPQHCFPSAKDAPRKPETRRNIFLQSSLFEVTSVWELWEISHCAF